jgi:hypothetical protein
MKHENKPKEQFKDRLQEWSEKKFGTSFSNLNSVQRSREMISFFVEEVLAKLYPGIVPDDEAEVESYIVDGPGDGGADLLYRADDGKVLIIQAKYRGKDAPESAEAIGRTCDLLERLHLAGQGKQHALSADLLELANQIDWDEDVFRVYFITTGRTGQAVRDRVEQGLVQIPALKDLGDRSEFYYLDSSGLNKELREALSSADFSNHPIVIPMIDDADGRPWCHFEGKERELYFGEVSGAVLANILQEHKASLFTMNIRDYVGDSKTNKQIIETARSAPENFEYFNNGVTAVAGKIIPDFDNKTLTCERMSIINGAQTVRSLASAVKRPGDAKHKPVSEVRVLFRLMSFKYPAEVAFVSEVTKYNNTQNAVKISDFRSNDEVQKDLARRFGGLNLNGRKFEYKNKRSDKKRNTLPITLEELTKSVFAFRFGPDDMYGGTGKLFDSSTGGIYKMLFENPDDPLTDGSFNLVAGTFFACDYIKEIWETKRKELRVAKSAMHPALERKGLVFFTTGELLRQNYAKQGWILDSDVSKLVKINSWLGLGENSTKQTLCQYFDIASKVLTQRYDLKRQSDEKFKHRNWFRDQETLSSIRDGLELALAFGKLPRLSI